MMYKQLAMDAAIQNTTAVDNEDAHAEISKEKRDSRKSVMDGHKSELLIAFTMLTIPMVALSAILMALVYEYRMPNNNSSYSYENETVKSLGSAHFVDYSSTTLVYLASLSSTFSTLLIPAAMLLSSFPLANDLARSSDRSKVLNLPSPYQLEMLIRMIDGRLMVLWSYFAYICGSKQRRTRVVPILWQAFTMLMALVILAVLISFADLWPHLSTKSVQYLEMRPEQSPQTLTPGRGFNSSCLQDPLSFSYTIGYACIVFPNDAVNKPLLLNSTEFFATAANYSRTNQVYLSDGYAVLGPADPSSTVDFQATSFGSKTACRSVTSLCGAKNTGKERWPEPSDFNFICNSSIAGLNMTGNFLNLTQPPGSVELSVSPVYSGPYNPEIAALFVEGNNTITPSSFQIGFQYFKDSQKQAQSPKPDKDYGLDLAQDAHRLFWAVVWTVPFTSSMSGSTDQRDKDTNSVAAVNIAAVNGGGSAGILSCETDISEVTYSMVKGAMQTISSRLPKTNASIPFAASITAQWGYDQLHQGIQQSFAGAASSEDFAAKFARVYDSTVMALPAGVMLPLQATNVTRRVETPVTRVPVAPFLALVLLNLLYAAAGVSLTLIALLAIVRGHSVRDAQARLSVAAVVAESFESPALGDNATCIDDLYAERRGMATRRVALGRREDGGRRYKLLVMKDQEAGQRLLEWGRSNLYSWQMG